MALAKRPDDVEMLLSRGVAYQKANKHDAAKRDFDKVMKLKPEKAPAIKVIINNADIKAGEKRITVPVQKQ